MKILHILRLLSGSLAKPPLLLSLTLLMADFNSILQTWTLNLGKCFMTTFMTSKQPMKATNFLLCAKGAKPRAWSIAQDLPGCAATHVQLACAQLWKGHSCLWQESVSSLSSHSYGLHGLPREEGRPSSASHIWSGLYIFNTEFQSKPASLTSAQCSFYSYIVVSDASGPGFPASSQSSPMSPPRASWGYKVI